jgi:hypothetical protein
MITVPFLAASITIWRPARRSLVRVLIYPAHDPRYPFLGVISRGVFKAISMRAPNPILAFAREGNRCAILV